MSRSIRIGTRGSRLAVIQTGKVRSALESRFPELQFEVQIIKTRGDKILDSPLSKIGGKGLFIREIEEALIRGRIDLAVHSLKDLPTSLPEELAVGGVLRREDPRDAFVSRDGLKLADLGEGASIGTSSLRRRAQILKINRHLQVVDIRGNIDTRLGKIRDGYCDALVLAACGLQRSGSGDTITEYLDPEVMLPAVCQGIIGIEIRRQDERTAELAAGISDQLTFSVAVAERAFLHKLEGGCQIPVGCLGTIRGGECTVRGLVADPDGNRMIRRALRGKAATIQRLATELADIILESGGAEVLESIRNST